MELFILISIALFMLFLTGIVTRIYKYLILSPIYIYLIFNYLILILTVLYFYFYDDKFSFYNLDRVSNESFLYVLKFYMLANICFLVGCIIFYDLSKRKNKRVFNSKLDYTLFRKYILPKHLLSTASALVMIITFCYVLTYGKGIFIRGRYIPDFDYKVLISIAKILSFLVSIFLGLLYSKSRFKSVLYFIIVLLLTMSTGSRVTFLLLLIYLLVVFQTSGNTLKNKIRFFIQLIFAFIFMSFVLSLRTLDDHGLIPYFASIFDSESGIRNSIGFNTYYTFIFGFFATIGTINEAAQDWYIIYISLNPLPGGMIGWYKYAPDLRLNPFAPFTLHGQVFNMGITFTSLFFLILGLILAHFERIIRNYLVANQ
ncbi:MAG: O-antigen polysaccharide polymerase Wzy, partial [Bacteroidia bacterium]|nr:O-antigen polysaccharide polymerase Wzy [Bacteroidia bacterium]